MTLDGGQVRQIYDALIFGYRSRSQLAMMVRIELNENLNEISEGANLSETIFSLIDWAERMGKVDNLIDAAYRGNPGNPQIKALVAKFSKEYLSRGHSVTKTSGPNNEPIIIDPTSHITTNQDTKFWIWFEQNLDRVKSIIDVNDPILFEIGEQLTKVADGLSFEMSTGSPLLREFIVSAEGNIRLFSDVIRLVGCAPILDGWKIIAFRQPKGTGLVVAFKGQQLSPNELWFIAEPNTNRLDIMLFVQNLKRKGLDFVEQAGFIALDTAIGEYDVETKLGAIQFKEAPSELLRVNLKPFHELPDVINSWSYSGK